MKCHKDLMKNIDILAKYISLYILQNRIKKYFYKFGTMGQIIWCKFYFIFPSDEINLNEIEFYIFLHELFKTNSTTHVHYLLLKRIWNCVYISAQVTSKISKLNLNLN